MVECRYGDGHRSTKFDARAEDRRHIAVPRIGADIVTDENPSLFFR